MTDLKQLIATAKSWVESDFDLSTKQELTELIAAAETDSLAAAELADRFSGPLKFGTAGLRAEVAAGESRMNRATAAKAAWGVAQWLKNNHRTKLVVGHDARHGSAEFALDTCGIAAALGLEVIKLESPVPTPVLAFALTELAADAGIMITASHNPAKDNGYKVYDHTGSQIISPSDVEIAKLIASAPAANKIDRSGSYREVMMIDNYVSFVSSQALTTLNKNLKIAYTALHGVGSITFNKLVDQIGYHQIAEVKSQQLPDPTFPTVAFPNPEEPGAMDALLDLATAHQADIAIANDPDADRTAVAVPHSDGWRVLSGDELGTLLAWWSIKRRELLNQPITGAMAASIVSGSMIKRIASAAGLDFSATLTGFKYVSRVPELIFGYEEAIGYSVLPNRIRDKDGISAALFAIELVSYLKAESKSVPELLMELYRDHGTVLTKQITLRMSTIDQVGIRLAQLKTNLPTHLGDFSISRIHDFADGIFGLPKSSGIFLELEVGRVIVRPSGTEPKLKCYIEVAGPADGDSAQQQVKLQEVMVQFEHALTKLFAN